MSTIPAVAPHSSRASRALRARQVARRFITNPSAATGVGLLAFFLLLSLIHPIMMDTVWAGDQMAYRPIAGYDTTISSHPAPPSLRHLLGTDTLGRDVLSMLMVSLRPTFVTAMLAAAVIGATSLLAAAAAATIRGAVDTLVNLVSESLLLLPAPVVIIVAMIAFPPDVFNNVHAGLLYGVLAGLSTATIVLRTQALSVMARPFVAASRVAGSGSWRVIRRELIPHLIPLAIVQMMVGVVGVIVATAFAQYLTNPNDTVGLGTMLYSGLAYQGFLITQVAWNVLLAAGLTITGLSAAFYLVGRGITQITDPEYLAADR